LQAQEEHFEGQVEKYAVQLALAGTETAVTLSQGFALQVWHLDEQSLKYD
jgi:hypothetical protein